MSTEGKPGMAIDLQRVVKRFGSQRVLDEVDLEVPEGRITMLLGPSGAGKTVTIKHVLGLMRPTSGFVRVEGRNLSKLTEEELYELRRGMSAVLQGTLPFSCGLFFSLDVFENVAFPLRERNRWSEERIAEVTMARLGEVGLRDQARLMPEQLSSGMAKRVALARALALEARIVIIDDFDSGIDGVRLALLCELIRDTQRSTGRHLPADDPRHVGRSKARGPRRRDPRGARGHERPGRGGVRRRASRCSRQLVSGAASGPIRLRDV